MTAEVDVGPVRRGDLPLPVDIKRHPERIVNTSFKHGMIRVDAAVHNRDPDSFSRRSSVCP